jgi:hypothetical protein
MDHDYAHAFSESVRLWRGGDLDCVGRFQFGCAAGWRNGPVYERHNSTGNGDIERRLGYPKTTPCVLFVS